MKNLTQNVVENQVPDPFLKNQNCAYFCINSMKCYKVFLLQVYVDIYQNIQKLSCWPLVFTSYKAFLKSKKRFATTLSASTSAMISDEKSFSRIVLWTDQVSLSGPKFNLQPNGKYLQKSIMAVLTPRLSILDLLYLYYSMVYFHQIWQGGDFHPQFTQWLWLPNLGGWFYTMKSFFR